MGTPVPPSPTVAHTDAPSRSAALRELDPVHVRFGSEAACRQVDHVRFTPQSGQSADMLACPLCAKSGLVHCSKPHFPFDYLIGQQLHRIGDISSAGAKTEIHMLLSVFLFVGAVMAAATFRPHSMKSLAKELSVRFLTVMIAVATRGAGKFIARILSPAREALNRATELGKSNPAGIEPLPGIA